MRISWPTLLLGLVLTTSALAQDKPEVSKVRLAVGGQAALYYLPLAVTQGLGLFRQQGLDVDISDFAGGSRALQALIGAAPTWWQALSITPFRCKRRTRLWWRWSSSANFPGSCWRCSTAKPGAITAPQISKACVSA